MNLLCNKCGWYGHFREGCEAFHRRKSEEGMEVDVEMQGGRTINGVEKEEGKDLWKTVQRPRRQRNPVTPANASHSGSRFTVLQEESGNNEEGLDAGKGKREEGTGAVPGFKKGLREEHQFVQKRRGKLGAMGESKKGNDVPIQAGVAGSGQMLRKEMTRKGGNVLKVINKGVARANEVGTSNVVGSQESIPESNLELFKGREVDMFEKENLHPGELREKDGTNSGGTKPMDGIEDPMDSMGMSMAEVLVWNSRGAASKGFAVVLKELRCRYKVDLVVIVEPRVSRNPATRIIKNWGFKHSIRVEAEGFSGGIWLLWSLEELRVEVLVRNDQFIHCRLSLEGRETLFTAVYASPSEQRRLVTWDLLQELASEVVEPWLLAGDFNEIKSPLEQKGGGRVNESRCTRFNGWIQNYNLLDMEAKGPFFTWKGPKWEGLDRVYKRLDRCMCNVGWLERFENAEVRVIPRLGSDHHPLLISLNVENKRYGQRFFRYEAAWKMHETFDDVMKSSWEEDRGVLENLPKLQQQLSYWNREIFGNIGYRKTKLLNR
ncbi:hypothetical protein K1719_038731 [Acacia pycnantha]|nr:hypothetical protein K1719_038731 [Acacia pycnantha]